MYNKNVAITGCTIEKTTTQKKKKAGQSRKDCPTFLREAVQVWGMAGQSTGSPP